MMNQNMNETRDFLFNSSVKPTSMQHTQAVFPSPARNPPATNLGQMSAQFADHNYMDSSISIKCSNHLL